MPTINELNQLGMGNISSSGSASPAPNQTVVITNGNQAVNSCLPCEDVPCNVTRSQIANVDLNALAGVASNNIRFTVGNTGDTDATLVFQSSLATETVPHYTSVQSIINPVTAPNAFNTGTFVTVNGSALAQPVQGLNLYAAGGWAACQLTLRASNLNAPGIAFTNQNVIVYRIPFDPNDSVRSIVVYDPFCDACFSANNDAFSTKTYTASFIHTDRNGTAITIPAGLANGIIEFKVSIIDLPSTQASTVAAQWL